MTTAKAVTVTCPECGGFLFEASDYGRGVCHDCGAEMVYRSKRRRREEQRHQSQVKYPMGG